MGVQERSEKAMKDEREEQKKLERKKKRAAMKEGADIAGTANGTAYVKQIEIVYTKRDGKRDRFVAPGLKGMK